VEAGDETIRVLGKGMAGEKLNQRKIIDDGGNTGNAKEVFHGWFDDSKVVKRRE